MSFPEFNKRVTALSKKLCMRVWVSEDMDKGLYIARFSDGTVMTTSPSCTRVQVRKGNFRSIASLPA